MINKDRLVKTFLDLIRISSPSGKEDAIAKELSHRLTDLGANVETDSYGNVIGRFEGRSESFMLNAHMDTVSPGKNIKPHVDGDKIASDGTTVLGGDPKAGIAAIIEALTSLKEDGKNSPSLEVVFTRSEEIGLLGAVNLDYSKILAKTGITFDGEGDVVNIDLSAPGYYQLNATITGRSAHAGAEPEKGISAIKIASDIIIQLPLGRIDAESTANIGFIEGGSARNVVPETATIKGELRSRNIDKLELYAKTFRGIFADVLKKYPSATVDLDLKREFDPYRLIKDQSIIQKVVDVLTQLKLTPNFQDSGGGTDNNIFQSHGISSVVIGTGDYDAHTKREYVLISQMLIAAQVCEKLIFKNETYEDPLPAVPTFPYRASG